MSDQHTDETNAESEGGPAQLRQRLEEVQAENKALRETQRELAFTKAGLDTENPLVKHVMTTYSGGLDKDAITAFAAEIGLAEAPPPAGTLPDPDVTDMRRELAGGDPVPPPQAGDGIDLMTDAYTEFDRRLANGAQVEDAAGAVFGSILAGASAKDPRFLAGRGRPG